MQELTINLVHLLRGKEKEYILENVIGTVLLTM